LIDPGFLLETKLADPARMSLKSVTAYWKHWDSQGQKGDFFSFLDLNDSDDGKDKDNDKSEESDRSEESNKDKSDGADGDAEDPPDHFPIDDGIPYPFLCDASGRTACLQELVSTKGQVNKTFHEVIKLVDSMEVSPIVSI